MSETTVHDESTSLKEELREADHEGEVVAAGGDLEAAVREANEKLETEKEIDPYLVEWNGTDDPENPLNFTTARKVLLMTMVAGIAFLTYFNPHLS
jgi:CRISPR/Cas system-associated protein Cas10 (large subunit of type III CRISPR-Cas system)